MTVSSIGDKARQYKNALISAAETAMRPLELTDTDHLLLVRYGGPSPAQLRHYHEVVGTTRTEEQQDMATFGNRSRECTLQQHLLISVYRPGDDGDLDDTDLEQEAGDRAFQLLDALEEHVRVTDTTLGGVVRHCFLTALDSDGISAPELLAKGRCIEIDATFTAKARISGTY